MNINGSSVLGELWELCGVLVVRNITNLEYFVVELYEEITTVGSCASMVFLRTFKGATTSMMYDFVQLDMLHSQLA